MVLTFINPMGKNYRGEFIYEFIFSKDVEINFGNDWGVNPASGGDIAPPPIQDIVGIAILKTTEIDLELAINSDHFSMYDCVERIIAMGYERESPDDEDRMVFHFGETFESIKDKLYSRDIIIELEKTTKNENIKERIS